MGKKYSNFLTILLIVIVIAIVAIIGFLGYRYYETYINKNSAEDFVDTFGDSNVDGNNNKDDKTNDIEFDGVNDAEASEGTSTSGKKKQYNGFDVAGTIEIPATN